MHTQITGKNNRLCFLLFLLALISTKFIAQVQTIFPERYGNLNVNPWENIKDFSGHLCAEYFNLAVSLVRGEGISNPFLVNTGPSAWMPPLLVWILAGLIFIFGHINKVALVFNVLQLLFIGVSAWLTTKIIEKEQINNNAVYIPISANLAYAVIYCLSLINFFWFYQVSHDHTLLIALLTLNLVLLQKIIHCELEKVDEPAKIWESAKVWFAWGFLVGITSLASPILAAACSVTGAGVAITKKNFKMLALAFSLAAITTTPWLIRNYLHFGKFIPIKSNGSFEVAFGNLYSKSGVYILAEHRQHPYILGIKDPDKFIDLGWKSELDIAHYSDAKLREYLLNHPIDYLNKVKNRLIAATFWYQPYFSDAQQRALTLHRILYAIPFICWAFLVSCYRSNTPFQNMALSLGALYLIPYILIAFYGRYSVVLLPLQALYIFWTIDRVNKFQLLRPQG